MDFRLAMRQLIRRPAFAGVALATLALGIGAPTAMFSVVSAVLLEPLPYPQPDRLVRFQMNSQGPAGPVSFDGVPASPALEWAANSQTLADLALFNDRALTLTTPDGPFRLTGVAATPNLFALIGVAPEAGQAFQPGSTDAREVVLSHATWQRFLGGTASTIGSAITLDGEPYRVVGVMPDEFRFPSAETAFWVPQVLTTGGTRGMVLPGIARLRPGATVEAVATEGRRLVDDGDPRFKTTLTVRTLQDQLTGGIRRILWVLLGAVGFVTIIATTNLALLLMTRGAAREREFMVRAALGAGRGRLIRQLFVEGMTLGAVGGAAGLGLAGLALWALVGLAPSDVPRLGEAALDGRVLSFALLLTIGTSLVFGVLSAAHTLQRSGATARPARLRLNVLVAAELALTMVLLVAGGLLLRSFVSLVQTDQGFDPGNAVALQINLPASRYPTPAARLAFDDRLVARLRQEPGIDVAGLATTLPTRQPTGRFGFSASPDILSAPDPFSIPVIDVHMVTDGFLDAMGVRLIAGRTFAAGDTSGAEPVIVISELFARQQFPGASPVGRLLYSGTGNRRVIGVVSEVRPAELGADPQPDGYIPLAQAPDVLQWFGTVTVIARSARPANLAATLRPIVLSLDPDSPPYNVRALDQDLARVVAGPRFSATVLALFAAVAFLMACVGVYGVMSYAAGLRTREVGIRVAIGATRAEVVLLMVKDSARVIVAGLAAGLIATLLLTRTLTGLLHEVTPVDPATLAVVVVLLGIAGMLASFVPARRASSVDPLRALREE
jgi:predicted permease